MTVPAMSAEVARQLGFALEELALNRAGQVSDAQHMRLLWELVLQLILAIMLLSSGVLALYFGWRYNLFWTAKVMPLVGLPIIGTLMFVTCRSGFEDYLSRSVRVTEGAVTIVRVKAGFSIQIGKERFGIADKDLIQEGRSYIVYSTKNGRLLSLEEAR